MSLIPDSDHDSYTSMIKLWVFIDMMLDRELCDGAVILMVEEYEEKDTHPQPNALSYVWDHAPEDSLLRLFCVEACFYLMTPQFLDENRGELHRDFLVELGMKFLNVRHGPQKGSKLPLPHARRWR